MSGGITLKGGQNRVLLPKVPERDKNRIPGKRPVIRGTGASRTAGFRIHPEKRTFTDTEQIAETFLRKKFPYFFVPEGRSVGFQQNTVLFRKYIDKIRSGRRGRGVGNIVMIGIDILDQ
jgi:hypothetical protein